MFSIVSTLQPHRFHYLMLGLLGVWVLMHLPGILYGAHATPLHVTYVGDEQVSVNSALRTLNEKSILAFRNREMQYYGPMFVVLDTPGVVADFAIKYVTGVVHSAEEYKQYIIWDWGGIIRNIRLTALLSMLLGLVVVYKLAGTRTLNPSGSRYLPYLTTALLAVNFHFFEYSNFSIHWAYVLPLLFVQWYTLVRILETAGSEKKYWVAHAAAVVISFGVSYMSLIYLAMWWPALWTIWRTRDGVLFKKWLAMMGGTGLLSALIVWWHPYAFFRIISFMGIGAPMHNQGDAQNPFVVTDPSWGFYTTTIVLNNLGLVLAFVLLLVLAWRRGVWRAGVLWAILLPGIMNFLLFAPAEHAEGRYALPTTLSIIIATGYLLSRYREDREHVRRLQSVVLTTLLIWYAGFSLVHIGLWMHIFAQGPIEQEAVQTALDLQQTGGPVLIVNSYIFGYPHTKDSYRAFAEKRGFGDIPLYKEIYANPLPFGRVPLDARYIPLTEYQANPHIVDEYPHTMMLYIPRTNEWNQFSYFDEDIVRHWYYRELSPRYTVLK